MCKWSKLSLSLLYLTREHNGRYKLAGFQKSLKNLKIPPYFYTYPGKRLSKLMKSKKMIQLISRNTAIFSPVKFSRS